MQSTPKISLPFWALSWSTAGSDCSYQDGWATDGPHALKIVNVATSGHPRVSVDGFLTRTTS